ncbi:hypothetical protein ABKN59_002976 [Abortiporus biennis]
MSSTSTKDESACSTSTHGGKVKQTRRRQRLSCVECTKRRQKCDRQIPCGLCVTRGIPHLCRWEPIFARPPPQRPPTQAISQPADVDANATIAKLTARVAALEKALEQNQTTNSSSKCSHCSRSTNRDASDDIDQSGVSDCDSEGLALIDYNVQTAAVALAQLSLAPRAEYVGNGSVLCAIHRLGYPSCWRSPYPHSSLTTTQLLDPSIPRSNISPICRLIRKLPPRREVDDLLDTFFNSRNGEFGIPEGWFRSSCDQMWDHTALQRAHQANLNDGCPGCDEYINPHWLGLLFAVLAITSHIDSQTSAECFTNALAAKRLVEDVMLASSVTSDSEGAVHGGVLSCLAAAILSGYLADRGRISEAWKMIGHALRTAMSLGLHRDPSWWRWEAMDRVEVELRVLTWWLLVIGDRFYSFILGRPIMTQPGTFETKTMPAAYHADGSPNAHRIFQTQNIRLSTIICEASTKTLRCWVNPDYSTVCEIDKKFREWEVNLPDKLRWSRGSTTNTPSLDNFEPPECSKLNQKFLPCWRAMLLSWYHDGLMSIHRLFLISPNPTPSITTGAPKSSREQCIQAAISLTRLLCNHHDVHQREKVGRRIAPNTFSYFVFDGAVGVMGALSQIPPHPQREECIQLIDRAIQVLQDVAHFMKAVDGERATATRAITILSALKKAAGANMNDNEQGQVMSLAEPVRSEIVENNDSHRQWSQSASAVQSSHNFPFVSPSFGDHSVPSNSNARTSQHETSPSSGLFATYSIDHTLNSAFDMSSAMMGPSTFNYVGTKSQPIIPYAVLQDVPIASGSTGARTDLDASVNWARLAGLENWDSIFQTSFDSSSS